MARTAKIGEGITTQPSRRQGQPTIQACTRLRGPTRLLAEELCRGIRPIQRERRFGKWTCVKKRAKLGKMSTQKTE